MKRIVLIFLIILSFFLFACSKDDKKGNETKDIIITYMSDVYSGGQLSEKLDVNKGLNVISKDGYDFDGWYTDAGLSNKADVTKIIESITLYASFKAKTFTITFDSDGGTEVNALDVKYGEDYTLPTPTKAGFNFDGWYKGTEKITDGKWNRLENISVLAKWSEKQIKATIYKGEILLDVVDVPYLGSVDMNKYLIDGLKFVSSDLPYESLTESVELHCVFEDLADAVLFIIDGNGIKAKIMNPKVIGIQIEFKSDSDKEFSNVLSKASTTASGDTYKFIYSNNKNLTSSKDLFTLNNATDVSEVYIKAYTRLDNGDIVEINIEYYICK